LPVRRFFRCFGDRVFLPRVRGVWLVALAVWWLACGLGVCGCRAWGRLLAGGSGLLVRCGVVLCAVCVVKLLRAHGGCLGIRSR
jgi:hypothetical protein